MASAQAPPPTVIAQKQVFLAAQTRLLSQPLEPSRSWLAANEAVESPIPDQVVEHVVARLNNAVLQHSRRAYSHQASRHVAEQIDALYLSQPSTAQDDKPAEGLPLSLDLTEDAAVKSLPLVWPADHDVTMYPMEAKRYAEQVDRLKSLAEGRQQVKARVKRLRRMKTLLDPFRSGNDGTGVQENLVTRDGEVEREMEKMRALLARVGGRVSLLPEPTESGSLFKEDDSLIVEPVTTGEKRKLDDLLDSF
ncbi:inner kinetochore subunit fta4 [Colletotrichum spaethianum]|uniref:Inner kinetochore subunit fta4 n=1 Tax=Colletotrichum spaethianum TaxID=700344 RepID=A0AA37PEU0_9PEZI|nr:inner kinetochore subunit fta4 [Colletotrichum spaethianum]GKT50899.1 inner kinetochore subunit fta4 [Colletotrichum spaethianum]